MAHLFIPKTMTLSAIDKQFRHAVKGYTISFKDFRASIDKESLYAIPEKRDWMLVAEDIEDWMPAHETLEKVASKINDSRAPLVWKKTTTITECFFVLWW